MRAPIRPGVPTPMCVTPFCSSFACSSICAEETNADVQLEPVKALQRAGLAMTSTDLYYLDVLCKKFRCFGFPFESGQLPANEAKRTLEFKCHVELKIANKHSLDKLNGSERRATDDEDNHRTLLRVLLLDL